MICTKCKEEKPDSDFCKGKCWCKKCNNTYEKERRAKNPEHQKVLGKARYEKNKKNIESKLIQMKRKIVLFAKKKNLLVNFILIDKEVVFDQNAEHVDQNNEKVIIKRIEKLRLSKLLNTK